MTIRTNLEHLRATRATIDNALTNYATWHRWIASLLPDGYPNGGDHTSGGDIADPTATTALHRHRHEQLLHDATRTTQQLHDLANQLNRIINSGPQRIDTTTIVRAARCSGAVDPTCRNIADGRRHKTGLCDRCWQQQYREQRRAS